MQRPHFKLHEPTKFKLRKVSKYTEIPNQTILTNTSCETAWYASGPPRNPFKDNLSLKRSNS